MSAPDKEGVAIVISIRNLKATKAVELCRMKARDSILEEGHGSGVSLKAGGGRPNSEVGGTVTRATSCSGGLKVELILLRVPQHADCVFPSQGDPFCLHLSIVSDGGSVVKASPPIS